MPLSSPMYWQIDFSCCYLCEPKRHRFPFKLCIYYLELTLMFEHQHEFLYETPALLDGHAFGHIFKAQRTEDGQNIVLFTLMLFTGEGELKISHDGLWYPSASNGIDLLPLEDCKRVAKYKLLGLLKDIHTDEEWKQIEVYMAEREWKETSNERLNGWVLSISPSTSLDEIENHNVLKQSGLGHYISKLNLIAKQVTRIQ